jgi:hypothetical protein
VRLVSKELRVLRDHQQHLVLRFQWELEVIVKRRVLLKEKQDIQTVQILPMVVGCMRMLSVMVVYLPVNFMRVVMIMVVMKLLVVLPVTVNYK